MRIALISPVVYSGFVYCLQKLPQLPDNQVMIFFRRIHNINLSVWSGIILFLAIV